MPPNQPEHERHTESESGRSGPFAHGDARAGTGSGDQIEASVDVPVNITGNSVYVPAPGDVPDPTPNDEPSGG